MRARALLIAWLLVVWVSLWEDARPGTVVGGTVLAVAVALLLGRRVPSTGGRVRPIALAKFAAYFLWKLAQASAVVAWEVLTPTDHSRPGIVGVALNSSSAVVTTIVANAVSLTPGTLSLGVSGEPRRLFVHVLHLRDVDAVRQEIERLEQLARHAFGVKEAAT